MLQVIIEPSAYVNMVAGFKSSQPQLKFILPKIALFFDTVHVFGEIHEIDILNNKPYARFSAEITEEILQSISLYPPPTEEQARDLRKALGDPIDVEGGEYAYLLMRALLDLANKKAYYLYEFPGMREDFIEFCLKYQPNYIKMIKESFLILSILEYIFDQEIPAFDPIQAKDVMPLFWDHKKDFQKGILAYANQFRGSYSISSEQAAYLKESLAEQEKRLIDFLQPENLKKYKIPKLDLLVEGISLLSSVHVPIGVIINLVREIVKVEAFKEAKLDFILSLFLLKKMANLGKTERTLNCAVCSISIAEIEKLSEKECFDILYNRELCIEHMVGRIDLRKRFRLYGKDLLRALKRLGDSSVFLEPES